jgi:hypothetical protein
VCVCVCVCPRLCPNDDVMRVEMQLGSIERTRVYLVCLCCFEHHMKRHVHTGCAPCYACELRDSAWTLCVLCVCVCVCVSG